MTEDEHSQAQRFARLDYEGFRLLARDDRLSPYERIGFPDSYRAGHEETIFADISAKLPRLDAPGATVLDIGPGCSGLPLMIIEKCERLGHSLVLVDSEEMLERLPDRPFIRKVPGPFPHCAPALADLAGQVDAAIAYSVLQYVFTEGSVFGFLDAAQALLQPGGGAMLIGDIPNASMRRRFLATAAGVAHHRRYTGRDEDPLLAFNAPTPGEMDDAVILALLARARSAGADAWVVSQPHTLPMANRREDILVRRP
ncbi:hypothetical protein [Falsiroseomonas sp. HW251]|uniref:hypothetical protein n=1 Tax=Falsiroseomonas sp. HW251 TaxID=3390998 RepID=UPI003D31DC8D